MNNRFEVDFLHGGYADITGEIVREPWDRYVPDPGRTIVVTPEMKAADAAQQAAREAERATFTWRRPEPLPAPTYTRPAARSSHQRSSTPRKPKVHPQRTRSMPTSTHSSLPASQPAAAARTPGTFRIVAVSSVPARSGRNNGLYTSILDKLKELPVDQAIELTCTDNKQATNRRVHLASVAKKRGMKIEGRVHGNCCSIWRAESK